MAEPSCVIASVTAIDVEMVQGADAHHDPGFIKAQVHLQVAAPTAESTRPSAAKNSSEDADADADADEDEDADDAAARAGTSVAPSTRIGSSFVGRKGKQFVLDGKPFFVHGWNTYWLMSRANDVPGEVERAITDGKKMGLNVCRTWAFYDGKNGLQTSPGVFNETMFKGLDFVIEKAKAQGIRLILTLVNYWAAYGGKNQYVRWSKGDKFDVSKDGTFFTDSKCKQDFKNFMKTVIMRMNTITKVRYRDEPTIFAWELMNEPRCSSDKTGKTLNGWIKEMGSYVKSLDSNHLLGLGSEGFYGPGDRGNTINPPGGWAANQGTDFVEDHKPKEIDFTSAHMYSDHWGFAGPSKFPDALKWSEKWVKGHIEDSDKLGKPFLLGEFGLENKQNLPTISANRAKLFSNVYTWMFNSSKIGGSGVSVLFWQLLTPKLQTTNEDGFGVTIEREPEVKKAIADHAKQLSSIKLSRQAVPIKKTDSERKMNGGDSEEKEGQSLQKVHKEEGQDGISLEEEGSDEGQKKKECVKEEEGMEKGLEEEQKEGGPGRMTEQGRVDA